MRRIVAVLCLLLALAACCRQNVLDFWETNGIDCTDIDAAQDRFAQFAELAVGADRQDAIEAIDILFDKLKEDEIAYFIHTSWVDGAFYNILSPCRDAGLYAKCVERIEKDGIVSATECELYRKRLAWLQKNCQGMHAVVPGVEFDGRRTLVLIVNLECSSCRGALTKLSEDRKWADIRRVAVCCGCGELPDTAGWEYVRPADVYDCFDPELTPVYFVVGPDNMVETSYKTIDL